MTKRRINPILWLLFSAGGVMAAVFLPVLVVLFGLAIPLGWVQPDYNHLYAVFSHWLTRLVVLGLFVLMLFHWAHRFKYTLYDGLQVQHLNEMINTFCYGGAVIGTIVAGYLLISL